MTWLDSGWYTMPSALMKLFGVTSSQAYQLQRKGKLDYIVLNDFGSPKVYLNKLEIDSYGKKKFPVFALPFKKSYEPRSPDQDKRFKVGRLFSRTDFQKLDPGFYPIYLEPGDWISLSALAQALNCDQYRTAKDLAQKYSALTSVGGCSYILRRWFWFVHELPLEIQKNLSPKEIVLLPEKRWRYHAKGFSQVVLRSHLGQREYTQST